MRGLSNNRILFSKLLKLSRHRNNLRFSSSTESSSTKVPVSKEKSGEVYDEKSDMIQMIDFEDLPRAQKRFAKQFEKVNDERLKEIFAKNYKVRFPPFCAHCKPWYIYVYFRIKLVLFFWHSRLWEFTFIQFMRLNKKPSSKKLIKKSPKNGAKHHHLRKNERLYHILDFEIV